MVNADDPAGPPAVDSVDLDAADVDIDGLAVGNVAVHVDGMRLDAGVRDAELVTGAVELDVRTTATLVVDWLRRQMPAWDIERRGNGLVTLRLPRPRVRVLLRPFLRGTNVSFDILGVVVGNRELRLPGAFVRTRVHAIPPIGESLQVVDAKQDGEEVVFRLRHEGIRQTLPLDALRTAIRDGATKLSAVAFG
jgi:hypothetical protein